jgi:hypothetical protein
MKDVKKMTLKELVDLRESIKNEIDERGGRVTKSSLLSSQWFDDEFGEELRNKGVTYKYWMAGWDRKIFNLCDLTFQNYKIARTHASRLDEKTFNMNGAALDPAMNPEQYKAMIEELKSVIHKYHMIAQGKEVEA